MAIQGDSRRTLRVSEATALRAAPARAPMLPAIVHQAFSLLATDGATPRPTTGEIVIVYSQGVWVES